MHNRRAAARTAASRGATPLAGPRVSLCLRRSAVTAAGFLPHCGPFRRGGAAVAAPRPPHVVAAALWIALVGSRTGRGAAPPPPPYPLVSCMVRGPSATTTSTLSERRGRSLLWPRLVWTWCIRSQRNTTARLIAQALDLPSNTLVALSGEASPPPRERGRGRADPVAAVAALNMYTLVATPPARASPRREHNANASIPAKSPAVRLAMRPSHCSHRAGPF